MNRWVLVALVLGWPIVTFLVAWAELEVILWYRSRRSSGSERSP